MSPTQRISEVIPWTKQVGVGAPTQRISEEIPWTKQVGVGAPTQRISEATDKASWGWGEDRGQ
ncbi:MAG: hypothetical protein E6678_08705 [Staphylococcus epidermidis]|nr:hypothetical protein [Staphylococcus epidermidis]